MERELSQFQKLVVQNIYIRQLNKWLDELNWENEKKDAIIEMKDADILKLEEQILKLNQQVTKSGREFKEYISKVKKSKINLDKEGKQQSVIDELRRDLEETKKRLKVSHRMNELLVKQNKF